MNKEMYHFAVLKDEKGYRITFATGVDPIVQYMVRVDAERVHHAIKQLPFHLEEIFVLRQYCKLSCQEIANILELSLNTVMYCLASACSRLCRLLWAAEPA